MKWENAINRLIEKTQAVRRGSEASQRSMNSTNPSQARHPYDVARKLSSASSAMNYISVTSPISGPSSASRRYPPQSFHFDGGYRESQSSEPYYQQNGNAGPSGYPQDVDSYPEDGYEYANSAASQYAASSGRGTPVGSRRGQSMVEEREPSGAFDRPRARTEDQNGPVMRQWRRNGPPPPPLPPPAGALPNPLLSARPSGPLRLASDQSDMSFGPGVRTTRPQPTLRSKFSANRLNSAYTYDNEGENLVSPLTRVPSRPAMRSRSASQPSAYNPSPPSQPPPPMPKMNWSDTSKGSVSGSVASSKRGSGSSEASTGESSDYSPHSTSPITPYGSSDSSLPRSSLRPSKSQVHLAKPGMAPRLSDESDMVKVKVHFMDNLFVLPVPNNAQYGELMDRVGGRIKLCGFQESDGVLMVKYKDEDGDLVTMLSSDDVSMAFEIYKQYGKAVELFITPRTDDQRAYGRGN